MNDPLFLRTRREFLKTSLLGGALTWTVPAFLAQTFQTLHAEAAAKDQPVTGRDGTILVVLQMAGGNDGLNTVVPFANDDYRRARPRLGIPAGQVLKLNDTLGFHPALQGLHRLWEEGSLGIVQGVGYPNPNRSHFRSTEIWQTASDANKFERHGWLGRYFDHACKGAEPVVGVSIGRQTPQAFAAARPTGVSLDNPERYRFANSELDEDAPMQEKSFRAMNRPAEADSGATIGAVEGAVSFSGSALDFLERTALDAQVSSDRIRQIATRPSAQSAYPAGALASSLRMVARMIEGGLSTRVYYVSQGGYDTHTNQLAAHDRLLREMSEALRAFSADLKAQGNWSRVVVMTFSEFGRRVAENANQGTDHGAAAPLFLLGGGVSPGLHGTSPSLAPRDLSQGDLRHTIDFRRVYASLLEPWLGADAAAVLGRRYEPLALLRKA